MYRPEDILNDRDHNQDHDSYISYDSDSEYESYNSDTGITQNEKNKLSASRKKKIGLEEQLIINKNRLNYPNLMKPKPKPIFNMHHDGNNITTSIKQQQPTNVRPTIVQRPRTGGSVQIINTPKESYKSGSISDYEKYTTTSVHKVQDVPVSKKMNHSRAYIRPFEKINDINTETNNIMDDQANTDKLAPHVMYNTEFIGDNVITNSLKSQRDLLRRQELIMANPYFQFYSLLIGFIPNCVSISSVKRQFDQIFSSDGLLNANTHLSSALTNTNLQSDISSKFTDQRPFQPTSMAMVSANNAANDPIRYIYPGTEYNSMYQRSIIDDISSSSLINGIIRVNMAIVSNLNKAFGVLKTSCEWLSKINDPVPLMFSKDCRTLFAELVASYIIQSEIITPVRFVGKTEKQNIDLKIISIIERFKKSFYIDNGNNIRLKPLININNNDSNNLISCFIPSPSISSVSSSTSYSVYPICPFYAQ